MSAMVEPSMHAVLPLDAEDAGEWAVPLAARGYRHPVLDDRVVVRLVSADQVEGADLAAEFLGLAGHGEPETVALGPRTTPVFPEWVLVRHPEDGRHALAVASELERIARGAGTRPKTALAEFQGLADRLASAKPHLLPSFYERAAREFLAAGNRAYAAQLFARARAVETEYALPIDEEHLDAVFLEFALAGAVQAKTLASYATGLAERVPPEEALRRFSRSCVRRAAGGVPPTARSAADLGRLARAAGKAAQAVVHDHLAEMLELPATARADAGWWKAHRRTLVSLARERAEIRGRLLDLTPEHTGVDRELPSLWLEILEECGATAALCDPENAPEGARPRDGGVGWLKRIHGFLTTERRSALPPALYPLVERMADRLRAELAATGESLPVFPQADLLNLLLALGVPVADPTRRPLALEEWSWSPERSDLAALAADPRFRVPFYRGIERSTGRGGELFARLLASPGGRLVLADWTRETARRMAGLSLFRLAEPLERLERLPGAVLALAEKEVREATATDLASLLARDLRDGVRGEPGRSAWGEALRSIDRATAAALIRAARRDGADPADAVRALLPEPVREDVIKMVGLAVRSAARHQDSLDRIVRKLEGASAPAAPAPAEKPEGTHDSAIWRAINGVVPRWEGRERVDTPAFFTLMEHLRRAKAGRYGGEGYETHLDGIRLPRTSLRVDSLLAGRAALAYRAVSPFTPPEDRAVLGELLRTFGELGMTGDAETRSRWRLLRLRLEHETIRSLQTEKSLWRELGEFVLQTKGNLWRTLLPLEGGAFLAFLDCRRAGEGLDLLALFHDPAGRFEAPASYRVLSSEPLTAPEDGSSPDGLPAEAAARGLAPWFPGAAEEFARLTGVTPTTAKLIVAGLPGIARRERDFLPAETRTALGVKVAEAVLARDELFRLRPEFQDALVGALVPADPSRLWTDGPDVAAAAELWRAEFGVRAAVPEALTAEAERALRLDRTAREMVSALFDPASSPELSRDLKWTMTMYGAVPEDRYAQCLTAEYLIDAVATTAWLAHRLPAGDPLRERLPAALAAVRDRLANPDLLLPLDRYVDLDAFRRAAGAATEVQDGCERYGAVILPVEEGRRFPVVKTALLDEQGRDPYLPVLRAGVEPTGAEAALGLVRDGRFAALLADPGDPVAGGRSADGTWWPQDPSRSVPDLVAEAADRYGLSPDAAAVYLMLLAMPDPADRNTARWTGWRPARMKAARAELAATDLVLEARRSRAGRSLFLPGGWAVLKTPCPPLEEWKLPLHRLPAGTRRAPLGVVVPVEPAADLYRRAWRRVVAGDGPGKSHASM